MITTILFDLGGVLFTNGTKLFISYLKDTYGIDDEKLQLLFNKGSIADLYRENKIDRDEYWTQVAKKLPLPESIEVLEKRWYEGYCVIEKTRDIITRLKKNYSVYFLSDNLKHRATYIEKKFGLSSLFHGGTYSHEVGVRKPHPDVYVYALTKMGVIPEEVVFIDDKEKNLIPAQKLGMHTILFTNPEELEKALYVLNVK